MKYLLWSITVLLFACGSPNDSTDEQDGSIELIHVPEEKKVDVFIDKELFTSYIWLPEVHKPIFYPILSPKGNFITRGYPIAPREGERADHRHQVGAWFNYGSVNGNDFWGHGAEGLTRTNLGSIVHQSVESIENKENLSILKTTASWRDSSDQELLAEQSTFTFGKEASFYFIDRTTTLTAMQESVVFEDTKEGSFAIRLNRMLELPTDSQVTVLKKTAEGQFEKVKSQVKTTGDYLNSEGVSGSDVWGKRAKWVRLSGQISEEEISVVIFDHPENVNYPTYWHARGYGLFSANPFGVKDFTDGQTTLNFNLDKGESFTMKYRILIAGSTVSPEEVELVYQKYIQ